MTWVLRKINKLSCIHQNQIGYILKWSVLKLNKNNIVARKIF